MGGLLKKETFALELSKLSGYNCQFVTFKQNEEQKLPEKMTGLVSIWYSPFQFNKVVLIKSGGTIESIAEPWYNNSISLRVDDDGNVYLKQTAWPSMKFRIACL